MLIEGVDFEVPDAVGAGASAVTAIVNESADVTLRSVSLTAGAGKAGGNRTNAGFDFTDLDLSGVDGTVTDGGSGAECTCPDGSKTKRGSGGDVAQSGGDGLPDHPGSGGEAGDKDLACGAGGSGLPGEAGPSPANAKGALTLGTVSSLEWTPSAGANAEHGAPGQGGGGGAGKTAGGGGSGGCGGCGGRGGPGGTGGGASIGLLSLGSSVAIAASKLQTADGGDGGDGVTGQTGQAVGGFAGDGFGDGCDGGQGGPGGNGGAGGGGAGGISVGIVHVGDAPTVSEDTVITVGAPGAKGEGGAGTNDGIAGVAQDVLSLN